MSENNAHTSGAPRWVKVFGVVAFVIVVLVVVLLIIGRGGHGPSRHSSGDDRSLGYTEPPPAITHERR